MPILNRNNCYVDPQSGGVIFNGSPELQEIIKLKTSINTLNTKLDKLQTDIDTLNTNLDKLIKLGGVQIGRKMGNSRFSKNDGQEI